MIINSCSNKNDNITNPNVNSIDFGDTTNAILLSSFEYNGIPYLAGWQPEDSISTNKYSFSNDVPNGGGNWSLQLQGVKKYTEVRIDTTITLSPLDSLKNYILTFWAKGRGGVIISLYSEDRRVVDLPVINCTSWTFFTDTLFRYDVELNKLSIILSTQSQDPVLYDNIKVIVKAK